MEEASWTGHPEEATWRRHRGIRTRHLGCIWSHLEGIWEASTVGFPPYSLHFGTLFRWDLTAKGVWEGPWDHPGTPLDPDLKKHQNDPREEP